jgi:outer membrane receptor protein involved in Fe transport
MKLRRGLALLALLLVHPGAVRAQVPTDGTVLGLVTDAATRAPLENARVVLRSRADSTRTIGTATAKDGGFVFSQVPFGAYVVECSLVGHTSLRAPEFVLGPENLRVELGALSLKPAALLLREVEVTSEKRSLSHGIDRRVYNVDHDLMAKSSSVSDLLQNIPSVQVDIDGNVSLRGSPDVMILINGKKSPLMGKTRADVLQQLPAATIEKIEVITNPSARFTPEGTSGIINIVTKSGTNKLHGSVFHFQQDDALDSRGYFDNPALAKNPRSSKQFGAELDGPLMIPGVRSEPADTATPTTPRPFSRERRSKPSFG